MTTTPAPTPMPACAPTGRPVDEGVIESPTDVGTAAVGVVDMMVVGVVGMEDIAMLVLASVELEMELEEEAADVRST